MKNANSRIGFLASLFLHSILFSGIYWVVFHHPQLPANEQVTSISMEMMAAILEQEQVAVAPEDVPEPTLEEPKPLEPEPVPDPIPEPPKQIEKPKEKPKDKPKEKVKKEDKKPIKALEKSTQPQEGKVAKAIPNAIQSKKEQLGLHNGTAGIATTQTGKASGGELDAYKAQLQRALQKRANNSYPTREKMMRKTGTVTLKFSVSESGQLVNIYVINSSGNQYLDQAALKAAEKTQMTSPPPPGFPNSLTVPIKFSLDD